MTRPPAGAAGLAAAVLLYSVLAAVLIAVGPGPSYDETLYHAGTVHLLTGSGPPPFTHSRHGWVAFLGRDWPLMLVPYVGAISNYLLLPVFAVFGISLTAARATAALMGAFGLWGVARLARFAAGGRVAAAAGMALALHPGYVSNTALNDGAFANWMAALGALCIALRAYLAHPTAARAAVAGILCGLGVWSRLNFAWMVAAAAAGALAGFGRRAVPPRAHAAAAVAGALLGSAPLLFYLARSRLRDTLAFMATFDGIARDPGLVLSRLRMLAETLLYGANHRRGVWEGPHLPVWQVVFMAVLAGCALLSAYAGRDREGPRRWQRASATSFLVLAAVMLWARLPVREHHLLTLVPLAAVAAVLAAARLLAWRPRAWPAIAAAAAVYAGLSLYWHAAAWQGLARTGGGGQWSDANLTIARYLDHRKADRVVVLDWGYHNSIYVATAGRVRARELFWYDPAAPGAPVWREEIVPGGVYLMHLPPYGYPLGAQPTARFRQALARSRLEYSRLVFRDRRGRPHTELIEVLPSR